MSASETVFCSTDLDAAPHEASLPPWYTIDTGEFAILLYPGTFPPNIGDPALANRHDEACELGELDALDQPVWRCACVARANDEVERLLAEARQVRAVVSLE